MSYTIVYKHNGEVTERHPGWDLHMAHILVGAIIEDSKAAGVNFQRVDDPTEVWPDHPLRWVDAEKGMEVAICQTLS